MYVLHSKTICHVHDFPTYDLDLAQGQRLTLGMNRWLSDLA